MKILIYLIPFIVGTFLPIQGGVNNLLSRGLGNPFYAAFFSFLGGTLVLGLFILAGRYSTPDLATVKTFPMYYWLGGLLGAMFVTSVVVIAPKTGIVTFLSVSLAGQFFMALIIDHFGLMAIAKNEINPGRIVGILVIFLGTYIIQYSKS